MRPVICAVVLAAVLPAVLVAQDAKVVSALYNTARGVLEPRNAAAV